MSTLSRAAATFAAVGFLSLGAVATASAHHIDPPTGSDANLAESWKPYVQAHGYADVACEQAESGWYGTTFTPKMDYALVVLNDGTVNDEFWDAEKGASVGTDSKKPVAHVIVCTGMKIATPSDTPRPTSTPTPSDTPSPTSTPTPSDTPSHTPTPTSTPSDTPSPTSTPTPSDTPSPTSTPTPSDTPTPANHTPSPSMTLTTPAPTGPVVETDVPGASGDVNPAIAGGGAVLMAGLGLTGAALRRKRQH